MSKLLQLSDYAQTAIAAYATNLVADAKDNFVRYRTKQVDMSYAQAMMFDKDWVVLQQSSPADNGFSAVLLQRKDEAGNATGEKVLAIAGTDPGSLDDLNNDFIIAEYGTALNMPQYVSLNAFYTQLVRDGKLGASEQLVVTGHSLGVFPGDADQFAAIISERPLASEAV